MVPEASRGHIGAGSVLGDEGSALAGSAAVIVEGLAGFDVTVAFLEGEGFVAFFAGVVDFLLAAQNGVQKAGVVHKGVVFGALNTDFVRVVEIFDTVLDTLRAFSIGEDET